ncbi:MAG: hypothetical protein JWR02_1305 [Mucilaginibacter sp.]|nr:hypothetical protein [Mucilaginibacter sp.]
MTRSIILLALCCLFFTVCAQTVKQQNPSAVPTTQPYGKVDMTDLQMTSCDFEKDANVEVLFDKASVSFDRLYHLIFERHIRAKIFNDRGKGEANVRIQYYGGNHLEYITGVQGETINLNNGSIEFAKIDNKLIYNQTVDKVRNEIVFAFPNVQKGSIIEYKYTLTSASVGDFPNWYFQRDIPTRYSELNIDIPSVLYYKSLIMTSMPFVKNTAEVKAMANIPSLRSEPYMSSKRDNYQRILYQLTSINTGAIYKSFSDTWKKVGENEIDDENFGGQFNRRLTEEDVIISKAKNLSTANDKMVYIFSEVKNNMKWDNIDESYTNDGVVKAWDKKTGNSTEINLIVYHLLRKAGVTAYPMLVSTRDNGKVNPAYPNPYQFNKTVVYVPVDSSKYYIIDASGKYNSWNETPANLLNGFGFYLDKDTEKYELLFLGNTSPSREVTAINAEIGPSGKMIGTARVSSFSYHRIKAITKLKTDGEKKYIETLSGSDNSLRIASVKFENMEADTLPLVQNINFNLDLTGSDGDYIYFKANLFSAAFNYPFLSESRYTDIDFSCLNNNTIYGNYKIPVGYKVDAMPNSISLSMPDNSITFKRITGELEGVLVLRYTLNFNNSVYFKESYASLREFFKKLNEMMNEQVVLKKL